IKPATVYRNSSSSFRSLMTSFLTSAVLIVSPSIQRWMGIKILDKCKQSDVREYHSEESIPV
ncbi:MAG: hypothetical protein QXD61_11275, partial [Candidatus Caldarchaeum sp.]